MTPLPVACLALYVLIVAVVCVYGLHRTWMVWRFVRLGCGREDPPPMDRLAQLPRVTVQLPMFNERHVARRVIEAACAIDYPRALLQVQVLDDSTDGSARIAQQCCRELAGRGHDVVYLHRPHREGFKAGALRAGLSGATGQFIAVFDADFVPPSDILERTIHYFRDPAVGMVQTRWSHLNRDQSLLTRVQSLYLDGHFVVEQTARHLSGRWFNFNGTAGVWRRQCIEDAGGWQHDTLTEDTDLSYRGQLRGWRFRYLNTVCCPAELPPTISAFVSQQHRWNKGLIQTAVKLLPAIWRSNASWRTKMEAWFHLTSPLVHVLILMLVLLVGPAMLVPLRLEQVSPMLSLALGVSFLCFGAAAACLFYVVSQAAQGRSGWRALRSMPALMALGVGISLANSRAVVEALLARPSPFVRTPKFAGQRFSEPDPIAAGPRRFVPRGAGELLLGGALAAALFASFVQPGALIGAPFLLLFSVGFLAVGWGELRAASRRRPAIDTEPLPRPDPACG